MEHVGFYNATGNEHYGKKMGEAQGSTTYIPITLINFKNQDFYANIEHKAEKLSKVLLFDKNLAEFIKYAMIETIRNVFEHSGSSEAFVCAQKWNMYQLVEIAVLDEGCGIDKAMRKFDENASEDELLELAVLPGTSAKSNHDYLDSDNEWLNSGYGLYILKELCKSYKGIFTLCSNNYAIRYLSNGTCEKYKTKFNGTAVSMRFSTKINIDFEKEREKIVREGQELAKQNKNAIKKASKSSGGNYGKVKNAE